MLHIWMVNITRSFEYHIYLVPRSAVGCALYRCPFFIMFIMFMFIMFSWNVSEFACLCVLLIQADKESQKWPSNELQTCWVRKSSVDWMEGGWWNWLSQYLTFPLRERSERVVLSACVKHGHVVQWTNCKWLLFDYVQTLMYTIIIENECFRRWLVWKLTS